MLVFNRSRKPRPEPLCLRHGPPRKFTSADSIWETEAILLLVWPPPIHLQDFGEVILEEAPPYEMMKG
jgi:hypothetical protein